MAPHIHIYTSKDVPEIAVIMMQEKYTHLPLKKRLRIRFIQWNMQADTFTPYTLVGEPSIHPNIYPGELWTIQAVTTCRLSYCNIDNQLSTFVCSVADYSRKSFDDEHFTFIFSFSHTDYTMTLTNIVLQKTSYDIPPMYASFCDVPKEEEKLLYMPEFYYHLQPHTFKSVPSRLVCSSSSPERSKCTNKMIDSKGRKIRVEKACVYIEEEN